MSNPNWQPSARARLAELDAAVGATGDRNARHNTLISSAMQDRSKLRQHRDELAKAASRRMSDDDREHMQARVVAVDAELAELDSTIGKLEQKRDRAAAEGAPLAALLDRCQRAMRAATGSALAVGGV